MPTVNITVAKCCHYSAVGECISVPVLKLGHGVLKSLGFFNINIYIFRHSTRSSNSTGS